MQSKAEVSRLPLSGVRILVGRARHQAGLLSTELRKLGATVLEIPFIEIRRPRSFKPLDSALRTLDSYDWLILTSVNGVEAMSQRMKNQRMKTLKFKDAVLRTRRDSSAALIASFGRASKRKKGEAASVAAGRHLRVAAIGPATQKAIEDRGVKVDVVPKEYVAESVVRSLRPRVNGKRVLLVRAKVARDIIPQQLRKAGARVDVVEAYETVVPKSSRARLQSALMDPRRRPHVVTFTSSSTARNFVELTRARGKGTTGLDGILMASIGPVTSSTLRELGMRVDIASKEFTIPGLVAAIVRAVTARHPIR